MKLFRWAMPLIVVLAMLLAVLPFGQQPTEASSWWDGDWAYRRSITFSYHLSQITLYYNDPTKTNPGEIDLQGDANWDFSDVRFVVAATETEIPTWGIISKTDGNNMQTLVDTTATTVYIYYGNPTADPKEWPLKAACPGGVGTQTYGSGGYYDPLTERVYVAFQTSDYGAAVTYYDLTSAKSVGYYNRVDSPIIDDYHMIPSVLVSHTGKVHLFPGSHTTEQAYYRSADPEIFEDQRYVIGADAFSSVYGPSYTVGQCFVVETTHTLKYMSFEVQKAGAPVGSAYINIYAADVAHEPTGASLATATIPNAAAALTAAPLWYVYDFGAGCTLTSGVEYIAIWSYPAGDAGNCVQVHFDTTSAAYARGMRTFNGAAFVYTSSDACMFREGTGCFQKMPDIADPSSYANPYEVYNGTTWRIYVFYRTQADATGYGYRYTEDDGDTWSAEIEWIDNDVVGNTPYSFAAVVDSNFDIHVCWEWWKSGAEYDDVSYCWWDESDSKWYDVVGTDMAATIGNAAPWTKAELANAGLKIIVDAQHNNDPNEQPLPTLQMVDDIPCLAWAREATGTQYNHVFTKWDGSDWSTNMVTIYTNEGAVPAWSTTNVAGSRGNLVWDESADCFYYYFRLRTLTTEEIVRYQSLDDGATWILANQITSGSIYGVGLQGLVRAGCGEVPPSQMLCMYAAPDNIGGSPDTIHGWPDDFGMPYGQSMFSTYTHSPVLLFDDKFTRQFVSIDYDNPFILGIYYAKGAGAPSLTDQYITDVGVGDRRLTFKAMAAHDYAHIITGRAWDFSAIDTLHMEFDIFKSGKVSIALCAGVMDFADGWVDEAHLQPDEGLYVQFTDDTHASVYMRVAGVETVLANNVVVAAGDGTASISYNWVDITHGAGYYSIDFTPSGGAIGNICTGNLAGLATALNVWYGQTHVATETVQIDNVELWPTVVTNTTVNVCPSLPFMVPTGFWALPTSASSIFLAWTKTGYTPYTYVRYDTDTYPINMADGILLYGGAVDSFSVDNATAGTTYYFSAWGYNACSENSTTYVTAVATTPAGGAAPDYGSSHSTSEPDSTVIDASPIGGLISFVSTYAQLPKASVGLLGFASILFFILVAVAIYNKSVAAVVVCAAAGLGIGHQMGLISMVFLAVAIILGFGVAHLRGGQPTGG